jgi:predicted CXXCH cytochrome family protein
MKKFFVAAMLVAFAATTTFAADTVTLKAKNGDVTFNHKVHGEKLGCVACHGEGTPAKFELDKDKGHALCLDCHKTKAAGPTKCGECHKK